MKRGASTLTRNHDSHKRNWEKSGVLGGDIQERFPEGDFFVNVTISGFGFVLPSVVFPPLPTVPTPTPVTGFLIKPCLGNHTFFLSKLKRKRYLPI